MATASPASGESAVGGAAEVRAPASVIAVIGASPGASVDAQGGGRPAKADGLVALPIALAAWLVPGAGHMLLGRWMRGAGIFAAVAGLVLTGCLLRGNMFAYSRRDAFGIMGFLADAGSGALYWLARILERGGPDVSCAAGDYGTRFIAAAGIVNVLAALDAYEVARRRRV